MARNEQQPEASDNGRDGTRCYTHPAFGQLSASRVQGSTVLYGSDFVHHNYVVIRLHHSELHRDLSRDWHFQRGLIAEWAVSEAQWATFVSSLNVGAGVPCTLDYVHGQKVPSIPLRVQQDEFKAELDGTVRSMAERIDKTIREMEEGIGASLSKKKRDELLAELVSLRQDVASNLPFVARSFGEHMEQTVEKAKVEVNAYVQGVVNRAGLAALNGQAGPLQLAPSTEQENA